MKTFINLLIFLTLSSCCSIKATKYEKQRWDKEIQQEYEFPSRDIPIIEIVDFSKLKIKAAIFPNTYTMSRTDGTYTPTSQDILQGESLLLQYDLDNKINQNLSKYNYRQYFGFYTKKGEKILLINMLIFKSACQKKTINYYLFDKYFLDLFHPTENEEQRRIILSD
ncbi:MAG: hypothetical protein L3J23_08970 [Flavobacteriaceae bacterium]|nr:hypothetical protein [Flavobacteriaceae bacterium]